jgi:hypothetical protein
MLVATTLSVPFGGAPGSGAAPGDEVEAAEIEHGAPGELPFGRRVSLPGMCAALLSLRRGTEVEQPGLGFRHPRRSAAWCRFPN